ncbi:SDR family oxidoreductase [Halopseudomonas pelagia]|uniref:SDR family oxidoreductase n=1 Tax=Halopseudomonas pelagia TaxID=553151 RepID=UPI00039CC838|nr:SDR family oxidoreductase [Halopseudomonas pelagia]|tara:strand:- start:474 stop:1154 length:681 start_codon:yes stop_codon:yes gene_type:complete
MTPADLTGKRILLTQADAFMGPALHNMLSRCGAQVIADTGTLDTREAVDQLVSQSGHIDVLVANLGVPAPSTAAVQVSDDEWRLMFTHMVDPLQQLTRAILPAMIERQCGKILLMGSASALRGIKRASSYSAARGAQLAYIRAVGVEVARHNIQVNAIAQNFVDNPTYFPAEVQANTAFQERLRREVPLGRLVSAEEDAQFAAYLCSDAANCFVGQIFPVCGGWAD